MSATNTRAAKKSGLFGFLGEGKAIWILALLVACVAAVGALSILGSAAATTTYYVLSRAVPSRTQITPDMLTAVTTKAGGQPPNALDLAYIESHQVFSEIPLNVGDVVTPSTVGSLTPINQNLPGNFVVASFQVPPEDAVAGLIRNGDYIDIIATVNDPSSGQKIAKVVLHHVLVLSVSVSPSNIASAANSGTAGTNLNPGPESEAVHSGIPELYTVGLTPDDATKLALVQGDSLLVVLSGNSTGTQPLNAETGANNLLNGAAGDSGAGTEKATQSAQSSSTGN